MKSTVVLLCLLALGLLGTVRAQDEVDTDEPTPTEVPDDGEEVEEVIEEPIILPESAGGTGGAVENPSHSEFLDSLSNTTATEGETEENPARGDVIPDDGTDAGAANETQAPAVVTEAPAATTAEPVVLEGNVTETVTEGATEAVANATEAVEATEAPVSENTTIASTTPAPTEPTTPAIVIPANDSCHPDNHAVIDNVLRRFDNAPGAEDDLLCDRGLSGWFRLELDGEAAEIPHQCVKVNLCGTQLPLRIDSDVSDLEPLESKQVNACTMAELIPGSPNCCVPMGTMEVRNCQKYFIYLAPVINMCNSSFCAKLKGEEMGVEYLGGYVPTEPTTVATTTTTSEVTTLNYTEPSTIPLSVVTNDTTPTLPSVPIEEMNDDQLANTVTIEFDHPEEYNYTHALDFDAKFRAKFIELLNRYIALPPPTLPPTTAAPTENATTEDAVIPDEEPTAQMTTEPVPTTPYILSTKKLYADSQDIVDDAIDVPEETRRRRKRSTDTDLKNDDINYAGPTPRVQPKEGGSLQVSNFVTNSSDPAGSSISRDTMMAVLNNDEFRKELEQAVGMNITNWYVGLPTDLAPGPKAAAVERQNVFEAHMGLFITMIIIAAICIILILIALICLKCRGRRGSWTRTPDEKQAMKMEEGDNPVVINNPATDEEIMKDEAPMLEHENPALTSNGSHPLKKDEDNGWVVPIDQLTQEEKEKPEVEDTKL